MQDLPTFEQIVDAADRISGHAVRTPLLESHTLGARLNSRLFIKPETLQRTGSFKFRGAYTKISRLTDDERARGVVAFSSGNHAQGVAAAAGLFGIQATIVMPEDAPRMKISNTRDLGADIVLYDRYTEDREAIGAEISANSGAVLVRPFDDPDIISGQGTVGLEIAQELKRQDVKADMVVCPCGGGGLLAGTSLAISHEFPDAELWGVEPEGHDDTLRSFAGGERVGNRPDARTICDALASPMPGELTFAINRERVEGFVSVTDAETTSAMMTAYETLKLIVEPGGAVALAAVLSGKLDVADKTVAIICSGGNVDAAVFSAVLAPD